MFRTVRATVLSSSRGEAITSGKDCHSARVCANDSSAAARRAASARPPYGGNWSRGSASQSRSGLNGGSSRHWSAASARRRSRTCSATFKIRHSSTPIQTGDPNGKGLPTWTAYNTDAEPYLDLGDTVQQKHHLLKAQLDFLERAQKQRSSTRSSRGFLAKRRT